MDVYDYLKPLGELGVWLINVKIDWDKFIVKCGIAVFSPWMNQNISLYDKNDNFICKLVIPDAVKDLDTTYVVSDISDNIEIDIQI